MPHALATIIALSVVPLALPPQAAVAQKQQSNKQKAQPKAATSLTGCVDEQDGQYVLIHDQSRSVIANLEAEGFASEGFAKHVGHKVTVRGTSISGGTGRPVFKVRGVETVSDTCGPQLL